MTVVYAVVRFYAAVFLCTGAANLLAFGSGMSSVVLRWGLSTMLKLLSVPVGLLPGTLLSNGEDG